MKKFSSFIAAGFLTAVLAAPALAADKVTVTGEGQCAKCNMHEAKECATVIQATENGKTVNYYLADNKVAKEFHENVCKEPHKVTATGTVKEKDGKKVLTASKIEMAK